MHPVVSINIALFVIVIVLLIWYMTESPMYALGAGAIAYYAAANDMIDDIGPKATQKGCASMLAVMPQSQASSTPAPGTAPGTASETTPGTPV